MSYKSLIINPGSTSTKIGVFEDENLLFEETLRHPTEEISKYATIIDQKDFRKEIITDLLKEKNFDIHSLDFIVGRGGLLKPIPGGTYKVSDDLLNDLKIGYQGQHASNLGGILAREIGDSIGVPSFIVDPVVVDELEPVARYSGCPELPRRSIFHALNQKAVARRYAKESGIPYTILEMNPETVSRYKNKEPISHGDASQPVILEHLGVYTARVLAIIISDPAAVRAITLEARRMNPDLYIVARTRFITEVAPLRRLGANVVIAEEFETSIEVFNQVLTQYLVPRQDIDAFSARLRQQNYRMIRRMSSAADSLESVASRLPEMGVQTMRLEAGSPLCGLSLAQSNLRREYAVTVVAVARSEQEVVASPPADFVMEAGDLLYLFGKTDKLFAVKPVICAAPATPATATAQEAHQA